MITRQLWLLLAVAIIAITTMTVTTHAAPATADDTDNTSNNKDNADTAGRHHSHVSGDTSSTVAGCAATNERAKAVKDAFVYAYKGYAQKGIYGHDEIRPVSETPSDSRNGWGATIIDSLDTMIIMGLDDIYREALKFLGTVDFTRSAQAAKGFETNIRYLGGLLSAYDLKGDPILIEKAVELTDHVLMPLFDSPSGAPYTNFDFNTNKPEPTSTITLAEFGTYTMEFTRLSQITENPKYAEKANSIVEKAISKPSRMPGLYPNSWKLNPFEPINDSIVNVGAGGDSYYEYLIKNYVLLGGSKKNLLKSWIDAVDSIQEYLLSPTAEDPSIQFIATITNGTVGYRSDELICFWPGTVLLGISQMDSSQDKDKYYKFAKTFMDSCIKTWTTTVTGIGPEVWTWTPKEGATKKGSPSIWDSIKDLFGGNNSHKEQKREETAKRSTISKRVGGLDIRPYNIESPAYNLRPETIESVFYFTRVDTHNSNYYKDIGWNMFLAIDKYTKVKAGYSSISNVDNPAIGRKLDFEESFFFAETLKYLYLMFTDESCMSLDEYVFTTEAHPLKASKAIHLQNTF